MSEDQPQSQSLFTEVKPFDDTSAYKISVLTELYF